MREHPRCAGEHELTTHDVFRSEGRLDAVAFLADLHRVRAITARHLIDLEASARHACALAFSRPCRFKQCQSSSVPKSKIRATGSCLLYAGRPMEQLPSDVSAEGTAVVPFWVRCLSHFTSWYLRRFRHRFLSSAWVAGVALGSFRLRTSVHCQRASHPGSCRDPTQAAHPSHRYSSVALLGTLAPR